MPTRLSTNFAPLKDSDEFESLIRDICALEWGDPRTEKFGRKGQRQFGVDIYGRPVDLDGIYRAAQCKLRTKGDSLTEAEIEKEVSDARHFPHKLDALIIATDAPRDTHTQILVDQISEREVRNGNSRVAIWFWDEIMERLAAYPRLIVSYYRDYFANLTTLPIIERLIDTPLRAFSVKVSSSSETTLLEETLKFRGIRMLEHNGSATSPQVSRLNQVLPDGLVCQLDIPPGESEDSILYKFAGVTQIYERQVEGNCPIFVLLPSELVDRFFKCLESLGCDSQRFQIITDGLPASEAVDHIFEPIFDYGYVRRGGLATIEITARANQRKPSSAFLDLDWHSRLSTSHFPSQAEWEDTFSPAIKAVTEKVVSLGAGVRVQIDSKLPLPAAFALGYSLNLRIARVGVWARRTAVSDFKRQFWLSDGDAADIVVTPIWIKQPKDGNHSAVVELTTYVSIHMAVESFAEESGLAPDAWLQVGLVCDGQAVASIDESLAVGYANQVGGIVRHLNAYGITDIHLFARIPSALAVLVGQRLQACGRIHLYWFDNPTYRFAFTLR
jgi:hypothetical protein